MDQNKNYWVYVNSVSAVQTTNRQTLAQLRIIIFFFHLLRNIFGFSHLSKSMRKERILFGWALFGLHVEYHAYVSVYTLWQPKDLPPNHRNIFNILLTTAKEKDTVPLTHKTKKGDATFSQRE